MPLSSSFPRNRGQPRPPELETAKTPATGGTRARAQRPGAQLASRGSRTPAPRASDGTTPLGPASYWRRSSETQRLLVGPAVAVAGKAGRRRLRLISMPCSAYSRRSQRHQRAPGLGPGDQDSCGGYWVGPRPAVTVAHGRHGHQDPMPAQLQEALMCRPARVASPDPQRSSGVSAVAASRSAGRTFPPR